MSRCFATTSVQASEAFVAQLQDLLCGDGVSRRSAGEAASYQRPATVRKYGPLTPATVTRSPSITTSQSG
jgi:hypothetical protein